MKRIGLIVLIVLFIGTIPGFTQRCLPKQWGIEINSGWGDGYPLLKNRNLDYSLGFNLFQYLQNQNKWSYGLEYMEKHLCYKCNTVPVNQFFISGGYWYNILSNRNKSLFFNIGGILLAGYETVNWGRKDFCDGAKLKNKNGFITGGGIALEVETYITNRFLIAVRAREKILIHSIKTFHFQYSISLKLIIK